MNLKQFRKLKKRVIKIAKLEVREAIKFVSAFIHFQVKIRPRLRLFAKVIPILVIIFVSSNQAVAYLKPKEAEIKINGQALLIADKTEEVNQSEIEIGQAIQSRRSPFEFQRPVVGGYLSQGYRAYHQANDIAIDLGTPIKPLGPGIVEFAGRVNDGKGNIVIVDHGDSLKSLYAHMGRIDVGSGNVVNTNTQIGTVGLTGHTTGPHVHFEIYDRGKAVDPASILPQ
jgi:murein DD-endopeptidase MepM/ murein hydrolase activator NlpD